MRRGRRYQALLAVAAAGCIALAARGQGLPSADEIARMREQLHEQQRAREAAAETHGSLRIEAMEALPAIAGAPGQARAERPDRYAWLCLADEMNTLNAVVRVERSETSATAQQALVCAKGRQWLRLQPGRLRVRVAFGAADGQPPFELAPFAFEARRNTAAQLAFTTQVELEARSQRRDANKAAAGAARERTNHTGPEHR